MNFLREILDFPSGDYFDRSSAIQQKSSHPHVIPYAIVFTPRSGSTFLTYELAATKQLGLPEEWLNEQSLKSYTLDPYEISNLPDLMCHFKDVRTGPNGIFGIELSIRHLSHFSELANFQDFFQQQVRWFNLRRRNVVAQAVSAFIAERRQVYHLDSRLPPPRLLDVEYDEGRIREYASYIVSCELAAKNYFASHEIAPIELNYEDLVSDPAFTVLKFYNVLGVKKVGSTEVECNPISKITTELNIQFEARFREENKDFLKRQIELRPPIECSTDFI
jgi:LPS sulfotransferase NodH